MGRHLGLSRSAVQERLKRLERDGVITGYTIVLGETAEHPGVSAHVLLTLDPKFQDRAMAALKGLPEVSSCYTVSGVYDAVAMVRASTSAHLDEVLTRIGRCPASRGRRRRSCCRRCSSGADAHRSAPLHRHPGQAKREPGSTVPSQERSSSCADIASRQTPVRRPKDPGSRPG